MTLVEVHGRLADSVFYFFLILAVWGLVRFAWRRGVSSSYWGALVIAEVLILAQAGLGAFLWLSGLRPERSIHLLYGIVSVLTIPGAYAYTKGREARAEMLVYGAITLVTVGLILRAITTAG